MKTSLYKLETDKWVANSTNQFSDEKLANIVLCFSSREQLAKPGIYDIVRQKFAAAQIVLCSTAGEIYNDSALDHSFIAIAMQFEKTAVESATVNVKDFKNTYSAAIHLGTMLRADGLAHVLVFSDGSLVNGSELVKGLTSQIDKKVLITGGLAGDGAEFTATLVGLNKQPLEGEIVALGLYGNQIHVTNGSQGGWDIFGLEKRITNSSGNVLVELDDQNALSLYKKYLGEQAKDLPGAALLFPLSVTLPGAKTPVVRTILSINEAEKSMTFAGDVPVGSTVRFMKANFEKLTRAAADAARFTKTEEERKPDFSLLISCVGRKLILGEKADEEVKAVARAFDNQSLQAGFYSYGEISPFNEGGSCQLHNQTMTITSFYEN